MLPERMIRQRYLLSALEPSEAAALLKQAHIRRYEAGDTVFRRDDPGDGIYGVLAGRILATVESEGGRELILNTFGPGDFFGEIALLDGKGRTATAIARDPSQLLFLARSDFLPFIEQRPRIAIRMIALLCERVRRTTGLVEDSVFLDVASRLAKQVLILGASHSGRETPPLVVKAYHSELAQMIGVSREAVSKQLSEWRDAGVVRLKRGSIVIDSPLYLQRCCKHAWQDENREPL
jgi:CRP-like cAMP-binding protein